MLDIERRLWHPSLFYTGRPDRRVRRGSDEWILDLKPEAHKKADEFQTSGYDPLFGSYPGGRKRASIHYQRDGSEAVLREHAETHLATQGLLIEIQPLVEPRQALRIAAAVDRHHQILDLDQFDARGFVGDLVLDDQHLRLVGQELERERHGTFGPGR